MSRAVRRASALLGPPWRAGVGLLAVDIAGLEDAGSGCLDRLEPPATAAEPAMHREQRKIPHPAMGPRPRTRQQNPGTECTATPAGLGTSLRPSSAAAGN